MNALDLIYLPLAVLSAPFWARKKRGGWSERFGKIEPMLSQRWGSHQNQKPVVLLHAVSVGEVNALRALIPLLTEHSTVVICTTTDTGLKRAQSIFSDSCEVVRYPLDCSWMVERFLNTINPDVVGLVELEVWPNFVKACKTRSIPIGIINGRLSARSFKGYKKARFFFRSTFNRLDFACMQDDDYAQRVQAMGARSVQVTGSMKWDALDVAGPIPEPTPAAQLLAQELGLDLSKPIVVAGSTSQDEEQLFSGVCPEDVQLICAPRKPEHFQDAANAMPGCTRRSTGEPRPNTRFLLDTIGELSTLYQLADLVIIGRSFGSLHGSDPLEPAALGKPILIGPQHSDFTTQINALLQADAIEVIDRNGLQDRIHALLNDPQRRLELGDHARACVAQHQGASKVHAEILLKHAD
ncbi:MAG: 3-deoxy-D-manno-octulosonic acid transferase [Phycisphaerales bacterium]